METIDITMPAVLRASVLARTLKSFERYVHLGARDPVLFLHIDCVGPSTPGEVHTVASGAFASCMSRVNSEPTLNAAMKWLWSQDLGEVFLHCEDDAEFTRAIDLDAMFAIMAAHPDMAYLAIPRRDFWEGGNASDQNLEHRPDPSGQFHWRHGKYRVSFGPGLVRRTFAQRAAELIEINDVDPEIQFHAKNDTLQAWVEKWTYATFAKPGDGRAVRDIGRAVRNNGGWVKNVGPRGTTWAKTKAGQGASPPPFDARTYFEARYAAEGEYGTACTKGSTAHDYWQRTAEDWFHVRDLVECWAPTHMLDYGCGVGRMVPHLMSVAQRYTGMDISPYALAHAKAGFGNSDVEFSDAAELSKTASDTFDLIWTCTVLQHVVDPEEVTDLLSQFRRVLRPGGHLLITEAMGDIETPYPHIRFRTCRWYWEVIEAHGFKLDRHRAGRTDDGAAHTIMGFTAEWPEAKARNLEEADALSIAD